MIHREGISTEDFISDWDEVKEVHLAGNFSMMRRAMVDIGKPLQDESITSWNREISWRCLICFCLGKHILLGEIINQETCWAKEKEYYNKKAPTDDKDKLRPEFRDWSKGDWTEVDRNRIPARWMLKICQYRFWILKCIFLYLSQACLHSRVCHRINLPNHLRGHNGWKA